MFNYDPSKLINSLAKSSEMLDRWDLNDFLKILKILKVSLIKDMIII